MQLLEAIATHPEHSKFQFVHKPPVDETANDGKTAQGDDNDEDEDKQLIARPRRKQQDNSATVWCRIS